MKALSAADQDLVRRGVTTVLQEFLAAEMSAAAGAAKRADAGATGLPGRGYYPRTLVTRVGKLELRLRQDSAVRF